MANTPITMTLRGHRELIAALDDIRSPATVRKIVRPAVQAAMSPINKAAKRKAPKRAPIEGYSGGQLRKSIGIAMRTYPSGVIHGVIGPRKGFKILVPRGETGLLGIPIDPTKYAHLVEGGTRHSAAIPFMRQAFDENKGQAADILAYQVRLGLHREAKRAAVKGAAP